jgi:hypothetical protein
LFYRCNGMRLAAYVPLPALKEPAMQDLNDLSLFAQVVQHGSFSAASRATGVPKSRLSRRIAQLEKDWVCNCSAGPHDKCA